MRAVVLLGAFAAACQGAPAGGGGEGGWRRVAAPAAASLRGLAAVDADVVWVGGTGGVWRTVDGGATWAAATPPGAGAADFRDVEAFDRDTAVVMTAGSPGRVHRTTDGGRTWELVLEDLRPATFFDAMAFAGRDGVLVGDPIDGRFCVWRTADGGASWRAEPGPEAAPGEAAFAASGTCVAAVRTDGGVEVWLATGGGDGPRLHRWRAGERGEPGGAPRAFDAAPIDLPLAGGRASRGAFGIAVGAAVVIVGGDYEAPAATTGTTARSGDGGRTWRAAAAGAGGFRSAAVWLDDARVLAVGSHGTSVSHDAGATWRAVANDGFHALVRAADGSVWAAGANGAVARWLPGDR